MKQFIFDRLVDRENICNLSQEQNILKRYVTQKKHVVVYAPRNYGKTSVVKNVLIEEFRRINKRSFIFFADLMEVRNMESLVSRLIAAFERSFAESFPLKNLMENAKRFIASLKPEVSFDELTGKPALSLRILERPDRETLQAIFVHFAKIAAKIPSLIVLDEFQDIVHVKESLGILREAFEQIEAASIIVLGSKRHLLSEIFAKPSAPLAGWGTDLEFSPIPYDDYHAYINERFRQNGLTISLDNARYLQDSLQRVPESVNRLCQQIMDLYKNREISKDLIAVALRKLLENRESRYEFYLARFSASEEKVLRSLAKIGKIEKPLSKSFLAETALSNRTVSLVFKRLMDTGVIERTSGVYRISDPLLAGYLKYFR
ncbi:MAG: hypothetical protein AB1798_15730 [Spirochaetota bacterium]